MALDRVRPHLFEIDVGSGFIIDVLGPPVRPVWSPVFVRTSPRVSAKAAPIAPTRGECGVRFISRIRAWPHVFDSLYTIVRCYPSTTCCCGHTLAEKGESISVAGACISFGHASNGPEFDTDLSSDVSLLRLIASASSI
jgi:hypothetical protein